ncbi:hypothetical protein MMC11_007915 [Xylographa trunciseda]|nr:hypothetical protein [Xylographa trunciseda]
MSSHRLFRFPKPAWLNSPNTRTAGVYFAGALFSLGFFFFIDAATFSRSNRNGGEVHIKFVDWIPGICSALGMLVINSIEKTRLSADSYSYSGTGVAWKARLVLFLGFALMAGGLAGSVAVLVLKYVVPEYPFPTLYFGIANVIANALIMLRCTIRSRWQRPIRHASTDKVIVPAILPLAMATIHGDVDKADRIARESGEIIHKAGNSTSKLQRRREARKRRSQVRLSSVKTDTTAAKEPKEYTKIKKDKVIEEIIPWLPRKVPQDKRDSEDLSPKLPKGKNTYFSAWPEASESSGSHESLKPLHSTKPTGVKGKGNSDSKRGQQSATTTVSEESRVDQERDRNSGTANPPGETKTTKLEYPPEVLRGLPFRRVTSRHAIRKVCSGSLIWKVASKTEVASRPVRPRRATLKQRRQEALERRRKLVIQFIQPTTNDPPQIDSTRKLGEAPSTFSRTIREALLAPSPVDKVSTKNKNEERSGDTTKKSSAKNVYKKNKEKVESVESEIKQKILKSDIKHINAHDYSISALDIPQPAVPRLSYGLDRVLFNPGVYHLQDPRSRVYNFDPYLQSIMPVSEFDFTALKEYITSSRDTSLKGIAEEHGKRYVGSTSSMTGILAHFHFLLSQWREVNTTMMSRGFPDKLKSFTLIQRCPSAIFLRWKDGTYAIDADKEFATSNILSMLGKAMEKLLTLDTEDFERYRKSNPDQLSQEERIEPEAFHYSTMGDFLMRSQLDAYDPRLPGTGMFDLKTRAVVTIRMDTQNPEQGSSYEIKERFGDYESFEREYFDMIRSAFLKYSLQVRMGRMDGIFVAFHNTERIFGFQYISLDEMDFALHGQSDTTLGDQEFKLSLELLNQILDRATEKFPKQSVRIHFETRDATTPFMYIFAEPVTEDVVNELQSRNQAKIEEFERDLLGLHKDEDNAEEDNQWDEIQAKVEEAMEKDERGEERSHRIEPSEYPALSHGAEKQAKAPTLIEADGRNVVDGDQNYFTTFATGIVEDDEEQDQIDVEDGSVSDSDQVLNRKENVEDHSEGDHGKLDQPSAIKHASGNGAMQDMGTDLENGRAHQGNDEVEELSIDSIATQEVDRQSDDDKYGTPNQQEAHSAFPGEHTTASTQTSSSDHTENFDSKADANFLNTLTDERSSSVPGNHPPVLAMTLTIRNKVDGKYVLRPENIISTKPSSPSTTPSSPTASGKPSAQSNQGWSIEYTLTDVQDADRAWALYQACQARRKKKLDPEETEEEDARAQWYIKRMRELNLKGKKWRENLEREELGKKAVVFGTTEEDA